MASEYPGPPFVASPYKEKGLIPGRRYLITYPQSRSPSKIGIFNRTEKGFEKYQSKNFGSSYNLPTHNDIFLDFEGKVFMVSHNQDELDENDGKYYLLSRGDFNLKTADEVIQHIPSLYDNIVQTADKTPEGIETLRALGIILDGGKKKIKRKRTKRKGLTRNRTGITRTKA